MVFLMPDFYLMHSQMQFFGGYFDNNIFGKPLESPVLVEQSKA